MNIENLKVGMRIPNYRKLCELLEIPVKYGNSKISQLNELVLYLDYKKDGNAFIINNIYETNKPKIENRGKKGIYNDIAQLLIIYLLEKADGRFIMAKSKLRKELGLVNDNYNIGYKYRTKAVNELNVRAEILNDFFNISNSNITNLINNAMNSLEKKMLINNRECLMIKFYDKFEHIKANDDQIASLLKLEKECLNKFNFKSTLNARRSNKYGEYLEYRYQILKQRMNIEFTYKAYDIIFTKEYLNDEIKYLENKIMNSKEFIDYKLKINDLYYKNTLINAEKRHINPKANDLRSSSDYVKLYEILCNCYISYDEIKKKDSNIEEFKDVEIILPF